MNLNAALLNDSITSLGVAVAIVIAGRDWRRSRRTDIRYVADRVVAWFEAQPERDWDDPPNGTHAFHVYNGSGFPITDLSIDLWVTDDRSPRLTMPVQVEDELPTCERVVPPHASPGETTVIPVWIHQREEDVMYDGFPPFDSTTDEADPFRRFVVFGFTDPWNRHWTSTDGTLRRSRTRSGRNPRFREKVAESGTHPLRRLRRRRVIRRRKWQSALRKAGRPSRQAMRSRRRRRSPATAARP